jgi:hypothetical protein
MPVVMRLHDAQQKAVRARHLEAERALSDRIEDARRAERLTTPTMPALDAPPRNRAERHKRVRAAREAADRAYRERFAQAKRDESAELAEAAERAAARARSDASAGLSPERSLEPAAPRTPKKSKKM